MSQSKSLLCILFISLFSFTNAFVQVGRASSSSTQNIRMSKDINETPCNGGQHPFAMLPGDPSLILTTNVDLGEKKLEIMKGK